MEIATETGLDRMGENDDEDEDDEDDSDDEDDDDDGAYTAAPRAATPEEMEEEDPEEMVLDQEAPEELEIIMLEEEPEPLQPCLFTTLMKDYEESTLRMFDDLDDLDDPTEADYDMDEWFPEDENCDCD
jgi:hypothetical protein